MKLIITTQHRENYATHDWDGTGEAPQGWKFKGGTTYVFEGDDYLTLETAGKIMWDISKLVTQFDDYIEEYVIEWKLEDDEWVSPFERDQISGDYANGSVYFDPRITRDENGNYFRTKRFKGPRGSNCYIYKMLEGGRDECVWGQEVWADGRIVQHVG